MIQVILGAVGMSLIHFFRLIFSFFKAIDKVIILSLTAVLYIKGKNAWTNALKLKKSKIKENFKDFNKCLK